MRGELLAARMGRFRAEQRWGWTMGDAGLEQFHAKEAKAEQERQTQGIATLGEADLRTAVRLERIGQRRRAKQEQRAAARPTKGPSPGM